MSKKLLYILWGGMFILCAGLGFIPSPTGAVRVVLTVLSVVFFLPPALLLYHAKAEADTAVIKLVRNLSAWSLVVTVVTLVLNFLFAVASEALGTVLHYLLVIVSSPMMCSGYWALSLFLWACLLTVSRQMLKK